MWCKDSAYTFSPCDKQQIVSLVTLGVVKFIIYYCFMDGEEEAETIVGVWGWGLEERKRVGIRHAEENRSQGQRKIPSGFAVLVSAICKSFFFFNPFPCDPKDTFISFIVTAPFFASASLSRFQLFTVQGF